MGLDISSKFNSVIARYAQFLPGFLGDGNLKLTSNAVRAIHTLQYSINEATR